MSQSAAVDLKVLISVVQDSQNSIASALTNLKQLVSSFKGLGDTNLKDTSQQLSAIQKGTSGIGDAAEKAKSSMSGLADIANLSKLKNDTDESANSMGHLDEMVRKVGESLKFVAGGFLGLESVRFIKEIADAAGKTQVLGTTLRIVGENAGYAVGTLDEIDQKVQKLGITAAASRESLTRMINVGLNPNDAPQLARMSLDAAALTGGLLNSSQAFDRLILAIQTGNPEMLREMGILINMEQAYARYTDKLGHVRMAVTELEKAEARKQALEAYAPRFRGAYEAAEQDVGKQLTSFPRYIEELTVALGQGLLPAYSKLVFAIADVIKNLTEQVKGMTSTKEVADNLATVFVGVTKAIGNFLGFLVKHHEAIKNIVESYIGWKIASSAVMLIYNTWTNTLPKMILALESIVLRVLAIVGAEKLETIAINENTAAELRSVAVFEAAERAKQLAALQTTAAVAGGAAATGGGVVAGAATTVGLGLAITRLKGALIGLGGWLATLGPLLLNPWVDAAIVIGLACAAVYHYRDSLIKASDGSQYRLSDLWVGLGIKAKECFTKIGSDFEATIKTMQSLWGSLLDVMPDEEKKAANKINAWFETFKVAAYKTFMAWANKEPSIADWLIGEKGSFLRDALDKAKAEREKKERQEANASNDNLETAGLMSVHGGGQLSTKVNAGARAKAKKDADDALFQAETEVFGQGADPSAQFNKTLGNFQIIMDGHKATTKKITELLLKLAGEAKFSDDVKSLQDAITQNKPNVSTSVISETLETARLNVQAHANALGEKPRQAAKSIDDANADAQIERDKHALDMLKQKNAALDDADKAHYSEGKIAIDKYYKDQESRLKEAADAEIKEQKDKIAKLARDVQLAPNTPGAKKQAQDALQVAQDELKTIQARNNTSLDDLHTKKEQEQLAIQREVVQLQNEIVKDYDPESAALTEINEKYKLKTKGLNDVQMAILEAAKAMEIFKAKEESANKILEDHVRLQEAGAKLQEAQISIQEALIKSEATHGNLTSGQQQELSNQIAAQKIQVLQARLVSNQQELQAVEEQRNKEAANVFQEITANPDNAGLTSEDVANKVSTRLSETDAKIIKLKTDSADLNKQIITLGDEIVTYGQKIQKSFTDGFAKSLDELMTHTKQAQFAFRDMALEWGKQMAGGLSETMSKGLTNLIKTKTSDPLIDKNTGEQARDKEGNLLYKKDSDVFSRLGGLFGNTKKQTEIVLGKKDNPMWVRSADAENHSTQNREGQSSGGSVSSGEEAADRADSKDIETKTGRVADDYLSKGVAYQGIKAPPLLDMLFHGFKKNNTKLVPAIYEKTNVSPMKEASADAELPPAFYDSSSDEFSDGGEVGGNGSSEVPDWLSKLLSSGPQTDTSGSMHMSNGNVGGDFLGLMSSGIDQESGGGWTKILGSLISLAQKYLPKHVNTLAPSAGVDDAAANAADPGSAPGSIYYNPVGKAAGGQIRGPGTTKSDSIPAMLSDEEFIMPADKTKRTLPLLEAIRTGKLGHYMGGLIKKFAEGGLVGDYRGFAFGMPAFADGGLVGSDFNDLQSIAIPRMVASSSQTNLAQAAAQVNTRTDGNMTVQLHPDSMNMTMKDWLAQEVARQYSHR